MSKKIPEGQGQLPFRRRGRGGLLAYAYPWERRVASLVGFSLVLCAVLYMYFVIASIFHVAASKELVSEVAAARSAVSVLETEYLAKTERITEHYARSLGFVTTARKTFVERENAVTLNDVDVAQR